MVAIAMRTTMYSFKRKKPVKIAADCDERRALGAFCCYYC